MLFFPLVGLFDHPPCGDGHPVFSLNLILTVSWLCACHRLFWELSYISYLSAGRLIKNERTGWYAALLYKASVLPPF
jgi:hypothetical protein